MIIDCGTCALSPDRSDADRSGSDTEPGSQQAGSACADCVVSVLLGAPGAEAVEIADEHRHAVGVLAESGLVPPLRLVRRSRAS